MSNKITLQINLSPNDWRFASQTLHHHVRMFNEGVDEIFISLDLHKSKGHFSKNYETGLIEINKILDEIKKASEKVRIDHISYKHEKVREISRCFFSRDEMPLKDFRGGPFYQYFYGLYASKYDYILHIDSDMLFGGNVKFWIKQAIQLLEEDKLVACSPLPGPPEENEQLFNQSYTKKQEYPHTYFFPHFSTRVFFIHREKFIQKMEGLSPARCSSRGVFKAIIDGNPSYDLPENIFSTLMCRKNLLRADFLGEPPGFWSLHPPYRTDEFFEKLPEIINMVESGTIPDGQRGYYDINDSLVDWSEAVEKIKKNKWWKRLLYRFLSS